MIARLKGTLVVKDKDHIIIDVGGVGYKTFLSLSCHERLPALGQTIVLLIHTHVREGEISLYGFLEPSEKELFEKLITVSGIGPKLALTILSGIAPDELAASLYKEDLVRLTAISGIGRKTAERMIVDLKDKLVGFMATHHSSKMEPDGSKRRIYDDLLSALTNLGYTRQIAERTISQLTLKEGLPIETALKEALKLLA
ncbi:MAG: Holliday junction branch migration protein RuvA [Deltaproteobacteria bacterium]|nr:Holliday junction branch migration protein RuvA [Deltaproteobacteria bacterium]